MNEKIIDSMYICIKQKQKLQFWLWEQTIKCLPDKII